MKTLEERLADVTAELERQTNEWERAMSSLAALGGDRFRIPADALAELDALVERVHTAAGGVRV